MPFKRPRLPNNTPEKSSDKSAKVDVCVKCSESVVEDCISCDWCTQWEHRSCANISENALEALSRDYENVAFFAATVWQKCQRPYHCIRPIPNLMVNWITDFNL